MLTPSNIHTQIYAGISNIYAIYAIVEFAPGNMHRVYTRIKTLVTYSMC